MWIPHNLLSPLKAESPKQTVQASEAATDERTFVVGFLLCNAITKTWETDVLVAPADARREIRIDGRSCTLDASTNVSGKLHEMIYTLSATGALKALAAAFRHVDGELSRMAVQYGRSFEMAGYRIADVEHEARWRCVPFRPSALIAEPDSGDLPPAYADCLRLYREARSATSPAWRLIAAGAILDAAVARRAPFDTVEADLGAQAITTDMLVRSGVFFACPDLSVPTARDLHAVAEPQRRARLSAVTTLTSDETGLRGDYATASARAALANLVDLVARDLVLASLRAAGYLRAVEVSEDADMVGV